MSRLFALLLAASMFHLYLVGSDLACASHEPTAEMAGMVVTHGASHAGTAQLSAAPDDGQCTTPVQPRCCEAMSSCGITSLAVAHERLADAPSYLLDVSAPVQQVPSRANDAPEPPPPKA